MPETTEVDHRGHEQAESPRVKELPVTSSHNAGRTTSQQKHRRHERGSPVSPSLFEGGTEDSPPASAPHGVNFVSVGLGCKLAIEAITTLRPDCDTRGHSARYGHASCLLDRYVYMFGGNKRKSELFRFSIETFKVKRVALSQNDRSLPRTALSPDVPTNYNGASPQSAVEELTLAEDGRVPLKRPKSDCRPSRRSGHHLVPHIKRLYLFGGRDRHGNALNDTWVFNPLTSRWTALVTRCSSVRSDDNKKRGGAATEQVHRCVAPRSPRIPLLTRTNRLDVEVPNNEPLPRERSSCVIWASYMYVFGGMNEEEEALGDMWRLDLSTRVWSCVWRGLPRDDAIGFGGCLAPSVQRKNMCGPAARWGHVAVLWNQKMFIHGGARKRHPEEQNCECDCLNKDPEQQRRVNVYRYADVWSFDFYTEMWELVYSAKDSKESLRTARESHRGISIGDKWILFGGFRPPHPTCNSQLSTSSKGCTSAPSAAEPTGGVDGTNGHTKGTDNLCDCLVFDFNQRSWSSLVNNSAALAMNMIPFSKQHAKGPDRTRVHDDGGVTEGKPPEVPRLYGHSVVLAPYLGGTEFTSAEGNQNYFSLRIVNNDPKSYSSFEDVVSVPPATPHQRESLMVILIFGGVNAADLSKNTKICAIVVRVRWSVLTWNLSNALQNNYRSLQGPGVLAALRQRRRRKQRNKTSTGESVTTSQFIISASVWEKTSSNTTDDVGLPDSGATQSPHSQEVLQSTWRKQSLTATEFSNEESSGSPGFLTAMWNVDDGFSRANNVTDTPAGHDQLVHQYNSIRGAAECSIAQNAQPRHELQESKKAHSNTLHALQMDTEMKTAFTAFCKALAVVVAEGKEELCCQVCFARPLQTAFMPCGHVFCCIRCTKRVRKKKLFCPVCRRRSTHCVWLHLP